MEEIRKAITELPADELKIYLEETIWDGVSEGSPEEAEIDMLRDKALEPFLLGYSNSNLRPIYTKLMNVFEIN